MPIHPKKFWKELMNVIWLDETRANADHHVSKGWSDRIIETILPGLTGRGGCWTVCHAKTANWFIYNELMFKEDWKLPWRTGSKRILKTVWNVAPYNHHIQQYESTLNLIMLWSTIPSWKKYCNKLVGMAWCEYWFITVKINPSSYNWWNQTSRKIYTVATKTCSQK